MPQKIGPPTLHGRVAVRNQHDGVNCSTLNIDGSLEINNLTCASMTRGEV